MLKYIEQYRWWLFSVLAFIITILIIVASQAFQDCICDYQYYISDNSPDISHPLVVSTFKFYFSCGWDALAENSDAIIAIFTIVIGFFTAMLFVDAREKGRKELRAYVGPENVSISDVTNGKRIEVVIRNYGQTIAKNVVVDIFISTPTVINTGGVNSGLQSKGSIASKSDDGVVMPNGIWTIPTDFDRTENNIDIFVKGRIDYTDIFGKSQWTTFRYKGRRIKDSWLTEVTNEGNDKDGNNAS